ncbi:MAG TPA: flagellar hook basal-body protein, partial [Gemmatimonadetes bacterium]|nr:flagellar hook basal-body protein [Gemmatimonadota bacterium]
MGYSLFQTPTLGMLSQAHALNTLGTNITNINTGGFKRTDTRFATVLGGNIRTSTASPNGGSGGVRPNDIQTLDQQGILESTSRGLDLAIAGDGFFLVSPTLEVSKQILYTRDGSFDINFAGAPVTTIGDDGNTISVRKGFLTDKNGFFLLGVAPEADGTFSETGALQALRVDQFALTNSFTPTTVANISLNLPAQKEFGEPDEFLSLNFVDS